VGHGDDVARFDRWAPTYDRSPWQLVLHRPLHRLMIGRLDLGDDERFLDVGCGTGNLALLATQTGARVVGVDPAPRMITIASQKAPPGAKPFFLVAGAEALPFANDVFDAAATSFSLHHWQDRAQGLAEIKRVVRPGGRVVIADPGPTGVLGRALGAAARVLTVLTDRHRHETPTAAELWRLVGEAGFVGPHRFVRGYLGRSIALISAEVPG
jgi:ubiquinone/menaquinone biosynthesis C-methylase UbiE